MKPDRGRRIDQISRFPGFHPGSQGVVVDHHHGVAQRMDAGVGELIKRGDGTGRPHAKIRIIDVEEDIPHSLHPEPQPGVG